MPDERADALPGAAIVVQKGPSDCNNLGPVTAGFNQAACGMFYECVLRCVLTTSYLRPYYPFSTQIPSMDSGALILETAQSWHFVFKTRSWK